MLSLINEKTLFLMLRRIYFQKKNLKLISIITMLSLKKFLLKEFKVKIIISLDSVFKGKSIDI